MLYSGIAFFGLAMVTLVLGFVGWTPGAAGLVNVALLMSMLFFLVAGAAALGQRYLPFLHRRQEGRR